MNPLVSVWMITYNHEKYIRQSLESVVMQKTNFPFEVIIGEDCSTDGTRAIIEEFEKEYPDIIKPIYHKTNVGAIRNSFEFCYPKLKGKYIACLEGDDYWTDHFKLQKQFDFLETNNGFAACIHDAALYSEKRKQFVNSYSRLKKYQKLWRNDELSRDDLIKYWFCGPTASFFFRNLLDYSEIPEWFYQVYGSDTAFMVLISKYGSIKLIRQSMSVYRIDNLQSKEGLRQRQAYKTYRRIIRQNLYLMNKFEKKYSIYFLLRAGAAAKFLFTLPLRYIFKFIRNEA